MPLSVQGLSHADVKRKGELGVLRLSLMTKNMISLRSNQDIYKMDWPVGYKSLALSFFFSCFSTTYPLYFINRPISNTIFYQVLIILKGDSKSHQIRQQRRRE